MVIDRGDLPNIRQDLPDVSIALRFGTYDILHSGHQNGIDFAASQADILVVGIMPDEYVRRVKGPGRPLNNETYRVDAIADAEGVDYSFIGAQGFIGAIRTLQALRPATYVEGAEHARNLRKLKSGILGLLGVDYTVHEDSATGSSSMIISRCGRHGELYHSNLSFALGEE